MEQIEVLDQRGERGEGIVKFVIPAQTMERERPRATHDLRIKPSDVLPGGTGAQLLQTKIGYDSFITLIGREGGREAPS